jgi:hypothetical protein
VTLAVVWTRLRDLWTIRASPRNRSPGLDYALVVVWTRALFRSLVLRDSWTTRYSPGNLCPGLDYALVAYRTGGQDGLLGTLALDAKTIQEDEKAANAEAERTRPGLTMFTDGSRLDSGVAGYQLNGRTDNHGWESRTTWVTTKTPNTQNPQRRERSEVTHGAVKKPSSELTIVRRVVPTVLTTEHSGRGRFGVKTMGVLR